MRDKPTVTGPRRGKNRTDSNSNRDMTCLRASLNHAFKDGLVTTDFAWRTKLAPLKNADKQRQVYLDTEQRRKLVEFAAEELANFLRGKCLIPVRPGALAAFTASSYDHKLNTLTVGKDKSGQDRKIALPDATADFFNNQCLNKHSNDPLLSRKNGLAWNKDAWKKPIKVAAALAKLPTTVTAYTLRHSTITDLVHGGLDTMTVAQLAGTSILMIEKHYGHLTREHSKDALSRLKI